MLKQSRWLLMLLILLTLGCAQARAAEEGEAAPAFSILSLEGERLDYEGGGPLLLLFWTSWCPNCAREMPRLAEIYPDLEKEGLRVMGINVGVNDSERRARSFGRRHGLNYPLAFDGDSRVSKAFGIWGVPTVILIDGRGLVRYRRPLVPPNLPELVEKMRSEAVENAPREAGIRAAER